MSIVFSGCEKSNPVKENPSRKYSRIISLAPNITEILYSLDLQNRVVGVTRFCKYPKKAQSKTKVGGYFDLNYEALTLQKPDLVICLPCHKKVHDYCKKFKISMLIVKNAKIQDILDSILSIGKKCQVETRAKILVEKMKKELLSVSLKNPIPHPKVLIVVSKTLEKGKIQKIYAAGSNTFYHELLGYAKAKNAYSGTRIAYPVISAEGILQMNPDVIIEIASGVKQTKKALEKQWKHFSQLKAVQKKQIHIFSADYASVPGPRCVLLLKDMVRTIHSGN